MDPRLPSVRWPSPHLLWLVALGLLLLVVGVRLGARWYGGQRAARLRHLVVAP